MNRLLAASILLLPAFVAHAASPVGDWTGRFVAGAHVGPPSATPTQRKEIARRVAMVEKGRLLLTLKPDRTYVIHAIALPMFGKPVQTGTWSLAGNAVVLKDATEPKPRSFALAPGGKRMAMTLPGSGVQVVFTR